MSLWSSLCITSRSPSKYECDGAASHFHRYSLTCEHDGGKKHLPKLLSWESPRESGGWLTGTMCSHQSLGEGSQHEATWMLCFELQPSSSLAQAWCITAAQSCRTPLLLLLASEGKRIFKILKKITLVWYQSTSSAGSGSCLWQWPTADAQEKNPKNYSFITSYLFQHSCATDSKAQGRQSQQAHNLAPTVKCSILIQSKTSELSEILSISRHKMKGRYIYQLCFWLNAHFS